VNKFLHPGQMPFAELLLGDWLFHLANRMIDARRAFHLMYYYLDLGIPDAKPYDSPGKHGESVEYLPDFQDADYSKKAWFNFYADFFSYKLFTAWDSVGQFLIAAYALTPEQRPSFFEAAKALRKQGVPLGDQLLALWDRQEFVDFREIRHGSTHNFLPGQFGGSVTVNKKPEEVVLADGSKVMSKESISVGVGKYVRSKRIVEINQGALRLFDEALRLAGLR